MFGLVSAGRESTRRGRSGDGIAVDDELDAAIALAAFRRVIGRNGLSFAEAAGGDGTGGDALVNEEITDHAGAAFAELLIEVVGANGIGVAFDLHLQTGMREHDAGNFCKFFAGAGFEGVAAGVEEDVGHIDDEAAGGVAGLED